MGRICLIAAAFAGCVAAATGTTPGTIIYDDDCTSDIDCVFTLSAIHHWIDAGYVNVIAFGVDSQNAYAAPVVNIMTAYWGHSIPIGTYKGSKVAVAGNASLWTSGVTTKFNPGDKSSNYPDCITVYRTALATAPDASVKMVSTGFLGCIAGLMASKADDISTLSGAQLIRAKVIGLYVEGGDFPTEAGSFNLVNDPLDANYVFANWTTQDGFPPIALNGDSQGAQLVVGRPLDFLTADPSVYASKLAGHSNRPGWDILSTYQAIFGVSAFTASANGTNTVNTSTGINTWVGDRSSGHTYYTLKHAAAYYNALLDGQYYHGAAGWMPSPGRTH